MTAASLSAKSHSSLLKSSGQTEGRTVDCAMRSREAAESDAASVSVRAAMGSERAEGRGAERRTRATREKKWTRNKRFDKFGTRLSLREDSASTSVVRAWHSDCAQPTHCTSQLFADAATQLRAVLWGCCSRCLSTFRSASSAAGTSSDVSGRAWKLLSQACAAVSRSRRVRPCRCCARRLPLLSPPPKAR